MTAAKTATSSKTATSAKTAIKPSSRLFDLPKRAALLGGASLIAVGSAAAAQIPTKSTIGGVTLYPDAAVVSRQMTLDIPAGEHEILLSDLPATLDPASLRVQGMADAKVVIGNVDLRVEANAPDAVKPETQRKLKALRAERDRVQDRIDAAQGKKAMIQRMAEAAPGKDGKGIALDEWTRAWDLVGKGLQGVQDELRTLGEDVIRIDAEIAALEGQPEPLRGRPRDGVRVAAISIDAAGATKLALTVSYRVSGAAWRPIYDARLDTRAKDPALEITRRAMIRQNTGEDWSNTAITLSTLSVSRGTAAPKLFGQKIAIWEPPPPGRPVIAGRAAPTSAPAPMAMTEANRDAVDDGYLRARKAAEEAGTTIQAGAYQTEFVVPGKVSITSGAAEKSIRLGAEKAEAELVARTAPVLNATAFLEVSFKQGGETALLPGEVLLSRDGAFIGKGHLPLVAPGETAKLGFGSDEKIKVIRAPVSKIERPPGLLGSTKTDETIVRTTARNLHTFPVKLQIEDRIPVSEDQVITVERMSEMTKPDIETPDDRRGVFLWTPTLKPGEERAFVTAYRIKWPADRKTQFQHLPN